MIVTMGETEREKQIDAKLGGLSIYFYRHPIGLKC